MYINKLSTFAITLADEAIDGRVVDACFTGLFRTGCLSKEP